MRIETLFVLLGLAIAAVIIVSATRSPLDTQDPGRTAAHQECPEHCSSGQTMPQTKAGGAIKDHDATTAIAPGTQVQAAAEGEDPQHSRMAERANKPIERAAGHQSPVAPAAAATNAHDLATEPITTRPVADRFDFIGPAIVTTVAEYERAPSSRDFASLPATELTPLPADKVSTIPKPRLLLRSLPPASTLTADNTEPPTRTAKAPQVAGWRMIRTIKTQELSEEDIEKAALLPLLPVQKPEPPASALTEPQKPSKISRRVRQTTIKQKPKSTPTSTFSDTSWKSRALFRDN